jgi:hypothetical protein
MEVKHCVMDMEDIVVGMRGRLKDNIEYVKAKGDALTKQEETRFEVGHLLLLDIMKDLEGVIASWREGYPARRVTEKAIAEGN